MGNRIKVCLTIGVYFVLTCSCESPSDNMDKAPPGIHPKTIPFVCDGKYFIKTEPAMLGNSFRVGDASTTFYSVGYEKIYKYDLRNFTLIEEKPLIPGLNTNYYTPRNDDMGWILTSRYTNNVPTCEVSLLDTLGTFLYSIELESNPNGYVIASTSDNGFVVAGNPTFYLNNEYNLSRYSNTGELQWEKRLSHLGTIRKITALKDGGFLIGGSGYGNSQNTTAQINSFLAKLDDTGNQLWAKTRHTGDLNNRYSIEDIIEATDGDYFLLLLNDMRSLTLVKSDSAYSIKWTTTIENNFTFFPPKMIQVENDVLVYYTSGAGNIDNNISLASIGANGDLQWKRMYGNAGAEIVHSLIQMDNPGYLLVGWTQNSDGINPGPQTLGYFIKTDSEGISCH